MKMKIKVKFIVNDLDSPAYSTERSTRRNSRIQSGVSHGNGKTSHFQWRSRKSGEFHNSMQIIFEDKDEGRNNRRTSNMGPFVCTRIVSGYMEGEHNGGVRGRGDGIRVN